MQKADIMSNIIRSDAGGWPSSTRVVAVPDRRTGRAVQAIRSTGTVELATVRAESLVQAEKLEEIDHLARTAIAGPAMLNRWAATLAQGDPFLAEDCKFFADIAKIGKAEVIADTIRSFSRGG